MAFFIAIGGQRFHFPQCRQRVKQRKGDDGIFPAAGAELAGWIRWISTLDTVTHQLQKGKMFLTPTVIWNVRHGTLARGQEERQTLACPDLNEALAHHMEIQPNYLRDRRLTPAYRLDPVRLYRQTLAVLTTSNKMGLKLETKHVTSGSIG